MIKKGTKFKLNALGLDFCSLDQSKDSKKTEKFCAMNGKLLRLPEKLSMKLSLKMSPINHPEIILKHFPDIVSVIVPKIVP